MSKKILDQNGLLYYDQKMKERFTKKVDKELKTGSESQYKVLSDNNLTDELLQKINDAGSSSFNGDYENLTNKPAIDGKELSSESTAKSLGLAKFTDIPDVSKFQTAEQVEETLTGKGYQTASDVSSSIESATTDMATQTWVNSQMANLNKKEVVTGTEQMTDENTIYLLSNEGAGNNIYDEYIVVNGKPEKIGTTEVDLSGYVKSADLTEITNEEIDSIVNG